MVREDQIGAAAVDVDLVTQRLADHGRALDMPPGPAAAPRTRPGRFACARVFPEGKVARVALARLELFPRSNELAVQIAMAQFSILRE